LAAVRSALAGVIVVGVAGAVLLTGWLRMQQGFSARAEPSTIERSIAGTLRRAAVPAAARGARNPFPSSPEILDEARAHFADHCASCHANNGSGDTVLGRGLYPRAPDMRKSETQSLTDGELYWVIHNGVRLSGMPAWGEPGRDDDSWKLVTFIRHLPSLTPDEEAELAALNPKTRAELEEEERDRRFLAGEDDPAPSTSDSKRKQP
jgi:mono/diheme cytochrome c family protein